MHLRLVIHVVIVIIAVLLPISHSEAQTSQMMSVTPPLFQIGAQPGDVWQSSIKVVNGNKYPLNIYTEVFIFEASGEGGQGVFQPRSPEGKDNATLADWIHIASGPHVIDPEKRGEIPFFVDIPESAPPGGHYAAIIISTQPPNTGDTKLAVITSQAVTSLVFLRVAGDVHEVASIREFRALKRFVQTTESEFALRFENKGNVHLQPRGDIEIVNMWGTERGRIPINNLSNFGNVLPNSIREFKFTWKSDFSVSDIGLYKAIVTLGYGQDEIQSTSATTYFWVIPIKSTLITLGVLIGFISLIVFMIKAYVRRVLIHAGVDVEARTQKKVKKKDIEVQDDLKNDAVVARPVLSAPLRSGVLDLRQRLDSANETVGVIKTVVAFILQYKVFFGSILVLIGIFVVTVQYISNATDADKDYTVTIKEGDTQTVLDKENIERSEE